MGTAGFMAPEQAQGDSSNDLARYRQGAAVSAYRETPFERAGRLLIRYQTFVWLVLSYLLMRVAFALLR